MTLNEFKEFLNGFLLGIGENPLSLSQLSELEGKFNEMGKKMACIFLTLKKKANGIG